jgi:TetR/AcrR family transcriptional repressor of nem operon
MPRTKAPESADTKKRIAVAALEQFHRKGYNGTSVQDIMTAVNAPKGTFYNHFASKEDLALDAVDKYVDLLGLASVAEHPGTTAHERLLEHIAAILPLGLAVFPDAGCLLANLAGETPAHSVRVASAVGGYLTGWAAGLTRLIEEARDNEDLAPGLDAADLAELIVNVWEGAAVKAKATASAEPVASAARSIRWLLGRPDGD